MNRIHSHFKLLLQRRVSLLWMAISSICQLWKSSLRCQFSKQLIELQRSPIIRACTYCRCISQRNINVKGNSLENHHNICQTLIKSKEQKRGWAVTAMFFLLPKSSVELLFKDALTMPNSKSGTGLYMVLKLRQNPWVSHRQWFCPEIFEFNSGLKGWLKPGVWVYHLPTFLSTTGGKKSVVVGWANKLCDKLRHLSIKQTHCKT